MILVTGASGALGSVLLPLLEEPHGLSRSARSDDRAVWHVGGTDSAVVGEADVVIHLAHDVRGKDSDQRMARELVATMRPGAHLVYISIVGIDGHPFGYYRNKAEVETIIAARPNHTILRATQFHGFVTRIFDAVGGMVVPARTPVQPVAVEEVAARLAELAAGPPAGRVEDLGGPERRDVREFAREYLAAKGKRRPVLPLWIPGRIGRAYRAGAHADAPRTGKITYAEALRS